MRVLLSDDSIYFIVANIKTFRFPVKLVKSYQGWGQLHSKVINLI